MSQALRSRLPRVLAVLLPLALGCAILYGPRDREGVAVEGDSTGNPVPREGPSESARDGRLPPSPLETFGHPEKTRAPSPGRLEDLAPAGDGFEEPLVTVEGRVTVFDRGGHPSPGESGSIEFRVWLGMAGSPKSVRVSQGRFHLEVPARARLSARPSRLGGRPVRIETAPMGIPLPDDGRLELSAFWLQPHRLLVLDAIQGTHIQDVTLLLSPRSGADNIPHPGRPERLEALRSRVESPIDLGMPAESTEDLLVGAPGYAWAAIRLDPRGGEQALELEPGGSLRLDFVGAAPLKGASLRVGAPGQRPFIDLPLEGRSSHFIEGLPVGERRLEVSIGPWFDPRHTLAEHSVDLEAGGTLALEIELSDPALEDPTPRVPR